jgi:neutral ceramidase
MLLGSRCLLLVSTLLMVLTGCGNLQIQPGHSLRMGAAEVDITPPVGHRMAGYFDERAATGVHDPLLAKALVFEQGREKFVFVFCDLIGPSLNVSSKARKLAGHQTGIPPRNIMICGTHSHTGPLFDDARRDHFHRKAVAEHGHDPMEQIHYPDMLVERIVRVIQEADGNLVPANLSAGFGKLHGFSFNRRFHMTNGTVQFNPGILNPGIITEAGPIDAAVGVLMARGKNGETLGGITVFACHCDTTSGTEYSADYPFYLSQALRDAFGDRFVSTFGAGTCGDINHINVRVRDGLKGAAVPGRLGTNLALAVVEALPQLHSIKRPSLAVRSRTLEMPLQEVSPEKVADARGRMDSIKDRQVAFMDKVRIVKVVDLARMGRSWPMEVQVFRFDRDTAVVCLPGEIFVELGLAIKGKSPFSNTMVISLCNDRVGYVPTLKAFSEGSYEVVNSRIKPGGGERLVEAALEMLDELKF